MEPEGDTPMARVIDAAVGVLCADSCGNVVVMTDGRHTCVDLCAKAAAYLD